jgi:hypothetical protein
MFKRKGLFKKVSVFLSATLLTTAVIMPQSTATVNAAPSYNYGEALQKSIMFYEFQRSGKLPADKRMNWRGDSGLTDGADAGVDLTGGWYDAGDHVKFNLPMAYTVSMLSWSVYEAKDAYKKSGQLSYILDNIKWATDFLIKCHTAPNEFYYQVGDGTDDHKWWGPCEVMQMARPSYKLTTANPGSTVVGEAAAALASASIIFKETDPTYAANCLKHAKELFTFADTTRSDKGYTAATNFYTSHSGFIDELTWASIWLYMATQDKTYLTKAESFEPSWQRENQSTDLKFRWGMCWDDKLMGSFLLLAKLTEKPVYKEAIERHLDWWSVGVGSSRIAYTSKGLAWLTTWGSLRHASTTAFLASVYADWSGCSSDKAKIYNDFSKQQIDYCLGSTGRSFLTGFGVNPPQHYHHRTAHGSWYDSMKVPENHRHTLIGALVGGPKSAADNTYYDKVDDYESNEVACDYNAGFVGACAKMYEDYGGDPIANYKAIEPVTEDEFSVEAAINNQSANHIEIRAFLLNKSAWPARMGDKLSFRYFVDLSEVIAAGAKPSDIVVSSNYSQGGTAKGLTPWDASKNIYYVTLDFTGTKIYPGGQSAHKHEIQFRISAPLATTYWDNKNDFSFKGISTDSNAAVKVTNMPVYDNGVLVYGTEPAGGTTSSTPTPTKATPTPTSPSSQTGYKVYGYLKPSFSYTESQAATVQSGFKVEFEGTSLSAVSDENGYFEIKNVPGNKSYNLLISKKGYLTRKVSPIIVNGDRKIFSKAAPIDIWAGDIPANDVQSNSINMADVIEVAKSFGKTSSDAGFLSYADFNKDNSVNMADVIILAGNFNKTQVDYPSFVLGDFDLDGTPYTMQDAIKFAMIFGVEDMEYTPQFRILSGDTNGDGKIEEADFVRDGFTN